MSTALVWFRRDLRIADQPALAAAVARHDHVVPVYVFAPDEEVPWAPGAASRWWLHHSLAALGASLEALGAPLILRHGASLAELRALVRDTRADAVYWTRLYEPAVVARDRHVKRALRDDGLQVESFNAALLCEPFETRTTSGQPYRVFTPFFRSGAAKLAASLASGRAPVAGPTRLVPVKPQPASLPLDALGLLPKIGWDRGFYAEWTPGEDGAHARLEAFCDGGLSEYRAGRDLPAIDATSRLSAALHFGEVSPLSLVARLERLAAERHAAGLRANAEWFVRELWWREFAHHLLFHFPRTPEEPLVERFAQLQWRRRTEYAADLVAWQRGRTGIPIVDAGMRQLWQTGWMHNRVRMLVASFLTKNLLVPWQEGARWFWDTLVDASLANNTLGWQWTAGCGADAAPYFRIFNPVLQGRKFDADGAYVRRYVPELARLSEVHAPWEAASDLLDTGGVRLGHSYPRPVADLAASRARALEAYEPVRNARGAPAAKDS
ncbi:MAG TPA: deoxyribodipyrimidine photo-lyase [Nevskiaceae bacterium]|nr:deoxyribodipyrimidine photo-lyase [Nevskiaceae bacterium]